MVILICEDNVNQAELLRRFLQPISSKIVIAYNMSDTMTVLNIERFDVITYDLSYPDSVREESIAKIKSIKEAQPTAIIIVVTGNYTPEIERMVIEAGADGIIQKTPENNQPEAFMDKVRDIVNNIRNQPSHVTQVVTLEKAANRLAKYYSENRGALVNESSAA